MTEMKNEVKTIVQIRSDRNYPARIKHCLVALKHIHTQCVE